MASREIPPMRLRFPPKDVDQIKVYTEEILASGMLTLGKFTKAFENEFGSFHQVKHSVAVNSGTSALEIALRCVGIGNGDEVLVPTNTFSATVASVFFVGGKPVLTDVNPNTLCVDAEEVERHLTSKTKAVIVVHIAGLVCPEIRAIGEICRNRSIVLIEDAAHAHGSRLDDQFAGSFGDAGCFSFYPTKVMTTGEGGMVTTNTDEIAEKARILRDQGKESFGSNRIVALGYNWRMTEISAAIGLVQMGRLAEVIEKRNKTARYYDHGLNKVDGIRPLSKPQNSVHNYYKYVAILDRSVNRESFKERLRALGVRCGGEVYWPPIHLQPLYQKLLGTRNGDFPRAEDVCSRMVTLPIYPQMREEESEYVIEKIRKVLSNF